MNKIISIALFASFLFLGIIACKKNNLVVDKTVIPPALAKFNVRTAADTAATYYIKSDNNPFKIPIGVSTVSDKDRTIQLCYTSSTATAAQYTAPATVVIPAGKAVDSLTIQGLFAGYPSSSRIDVVYIKICGGDVPASDYWTTYKLTLRKYCDVNINTFLGDYTQSTDQQIGSPATGQYTATITSITSTGPTSATAIVYDFGDPEFGAPYDPGDLAVNPGITINLDWADPANFKVTVAPSQAISQYWYGPTGLINAASTGPGTFSSCDNTFTVRYSFKIGSTNYGNFVTVLRR